MQSTAFKYFDHRRGLHINTKRQQFDRQSKVIPALYAAGEGTGGVLGTNLLGGNATASIYDYGHIAGASAASEV